MSSVIPFGHELPSVGSVGFSANASGANDNAFEIAAVILLAGIFSKIAISGFPLEKSIAFVAFSDEEERLIGFEYFVKHKPIVLDSNSSENKKYLLKKQSQQAIWKQNKLITIED